MSQTSLTMAANGRIVIPSGLRRALDLGEGAKVMARIEGGALVLEPIALAIKRAQAAVRALGPGPSPVDELIAERREASRLE